MKVFLAHLCYSSYCSVPNLYHRQKDTTHYTWTTHTNTCYLFRFSERLVSNIPGWCTLNQNLYQDKWEKPSEKPDTNNYYKLQENCLENITTDSEWLMTTSLKINVQPCSNGLSPLLKCQTSCFVTLWQQHFGLPMWIATYFFTPVQVMFL
jgi:hypothetical protein